MSKLLINDMLAEVYPILKNKTEHIQPNVFEFFNDNQPVVIFLSATDQKTRAKVVTAKADTFANSWKLAVQKLKTMLLKHKMKAAWIKADLVVTVETKNFAHFF